MTAPAEIPLLTTVVPSDKPMTINGSGPSSRIQPPPNSPGNQSQSLSANFANYFTADLLLYAGIALLSLGAIIWLMQRVKSVTVAAQGQKAAPTEAGFSIQEIQRLKDQGLLSEREYQKAMARARAGAPDEPPSTPDSPPPAPPDPQPPKGPPSGTSPNPRNGELW